jgi:hypothetical protein
VAARGSACNEERTVNNVPRLRRTSEPNGVTCPCCGNLEYMPIEMVLDEERFSVFMCDPCVEKLHALLDTARQKEQWGLPMGALS